MDVTEVLWGIAAGLFIILNYSAPLPIQLLLYSIARRIFRKAPDAAVYAICLAVTTALLYPLYLWNITPLDPDPIDKFDAFDGLIVLCLWAPWYLGLVIIGIVKLIKQIKPKTHTEHDKEDWL